MQVATTNSVISSSVVGNTTTSSSPANVAAAAAAAAAAGIQIDPTTTQIIIDHPLYPLLQMVFQKCELATSSPRDSQAETICSSESFGDDIRNFINEARHRNMPLRTGADDVDQFMLKAIEVLRIHLLELEKVHQLCDNFCQRYINCLKGKLPIDLVVDDGSSRDTNSTSRNGNQHQDVGPSSNNSSSNAANNNGNNNNNQNSQNGQSNSEQQHSTSNNNSNHHNHHHHNQPTQQQLQHTNHQSNNNHHHHSQDALGANGYPHGPADAAAAAYHQSYVSYTPGSYGAQNPYAAAHHAAYAAGSAAAAAAAAGMPHYQAPGGDHHHSANMKHESGNNNSANHHHRELTASSGSSSASSVKLEHGGQYGAETNSATTAPDRHQLHDDVRSPTGSTGSFLGDASLASGDGTEEDEDNRARRQQKKRGIFPKAATNIMRAWLFQHLNHPYPSEDQKKQLAEETGLTILQVNNWFINARRRIVQPMIDQSNRTSGNIMAGPAYSPDAGTMGYMLGAAADAGGPQPFGAAAAGGPAGAMNPLASHAAMTSAMGAYSAASAQHLSQYNRQQQQHAAMLGLSTPPAGSHMMGHPTLPPHDYY